MASNSRRVGQLAACLCKTACAVLALAVSLLMALAPSSYALAPGAIEEFPVQTYYRLSLRGIATGPEGSIWFLQSGRGDGQIERMTTSGELLGGRHFDGIDDANDLVEGPDGNMWVTLSDEVDEGVGGVARLTPAEELLFFPIGSPLPAGTCCGGGADAIAVGGDGALWFTEDWRDAMGPIFIGRIDTSGNVTEYPLPIGSGPGMPVETEPEDLALGADGNIWFTDDGHDAEGHNLVGKITPSGTVSEYPIPAAGSEPAAIALGADGDMWFAEPGVGRIGRVTPGGAITEFSAPHVSGYMHGLIRGPDGKIWFGEGSPAGFGSISRTGELHSYTPSFVTGPGYLTVGPEGNIWFTDQHFAMEGFTYVGRFAVPFPPVSATAPTIAGTTTGGEVLSASAGSWLHEPQSLAYQWQRCDPAGASCASVPGAQNSTYGLSSDDVGHTIRVLVLAGNLGGTASATSAPTAVVAAAKPPPEPPPIRIRVVGANITWRFARSHGQSFARTLVIHGLSAGMSIRTTCAGYGCRFSRGRAAGPHVPRCSTRSCSYTRAAGHEATLDLAALLGSAKLKPGARITIVVIEGGMIGKAFELTVRRHGQPTLQVTCRSTGSYTAVHEC